ncbi:MAG: hypothetical protein OSB57_04115 [Planctomycetota bacterium]|nr:hypothetical protein [Planctomycetota bacterium]
MSLRRRLSWEQDEGLRGQYGCVELRAPDAHATRGVPRAPGYPVLLIEQILGMQSLASLEPDQEELEVQACRLGLGRGLGLGLGRPDPQAPI